MQAADRSWKVEEVVPLLRDLSFFEGLPDADLEFAAGILGVSSLQSGGTLFREGDPGDAFYIVLEGGVDLTMTRPSGETEKLARRRPGECLGEAALLHGGPHSAAAVAVGPCVLLRTDEAGFRRLLTNNRLALRVLASMARAHRALDLRLSAQDRLRYAARENAGGARDLSRIIQRGLLPREAPRIEGFDIAAGTILAEDGPGKTLWDHFQLRDGRRGLVSLSVLGEGLPPAYCLAVTRSLLRELAREMEDLSGLLVRVNSALASSAVVEGVAQFVEVGIVVPSGSRVEWAGAGRCPGAMIRRNGVFQEFTSNGPPLGMLEGFLYRAQPLELGAGDAVLVLSEASQGVFRGAADLVASLQGKPVGDVVSMLQKALRKALQDTPPEASVLFIRKQ